MAVTKIAILALAGMLTAAPAIAQQAQSAAPTWGPRPQNPVRPFPYKEIAVDYANLYHPGVHLAGTLTVPPGKGPFPTVLLITGSGVQDRDETLVGHKPFLVVSDYLTRRGIAVLRVDDRGAGATKGGTPDDTTNDFVTDVKSGVQFLKTRPEVDHKRIGLIGHSEGGLIAPLAVRDNPDVAFAVLWAGTAVSGREVIVEQVRAVARSNGGTPEQVAAAGEQERKLVDAIAGARDDASAYAAAIKVVSPNGPPSEAMARGIKRSSGAWFRNFVNYDPAPTLRALRIPVLALVGGKDVQVVASQNTPALRAALAGNPRAKVMELPGLNHLFQTAGTGSPAEYGKIEETIAPSALKIMGDWIEGVTRRR